MSNQLKNKVIKHLNSKIKDKRIPYTISKVLNDNIHKDKDLVASTIFQLAIDDHVKLCVTRGYITNLQINDYLIYLLR